MGFYPLQFLCSRGRLAMTRLRLFVIVLLGWGGLVSASSCSSDSLSSESSAHAVESPDAEKPVCLLPLEAGTPPSTGCPTLCSAIIGKQLVQPTGCVIDVLIGCADCSAGCGGPPEGMCWVSEQDGRVVLVNNSTSFATGAWRLCTDEQFTQIRGAPPC